MSTSDIKELKGKTLTSIDGKVGYERITFHVDDGTSYSLFHQQDCCESVQVEDICGDLSDLIGSPIVQATERTSDKWPKGIPNPEYVDSFTWTFYRLATVKGVVVIRWYGSSNGYYSESVSFAKVQ